MKELYVSKLIKCSVALLISLNVGTTALAQYPENVMMPGMAQFEELDINNDGRVSKDEIRRKNESIKYLYCGSKLTILKANSSSLMAGVFFVTVTNNNL